MVASIVYRNAMDFALPYNIPGQRSGKQTPFDILQKQFAQGQIKYEEYNEKMRILEIDSAKGYK